MGAAAAAVLLCGYASPAYGHGAIHHTTTNGSIAVRVVHHDGQPMAHSAVRVHAPGARDTPWQEGVTDPHGVFAFLPDRGGVWRVTVNDAMGHRVDVAVDVDEAHTGHVAPPRTHIGRLPAAVFGVGVILAAFGGWSLWAQRRTVGRGSAP